MAPTASIQARDSSGSMAISVSAIVGICIGGTLFVFAVLIAVLALHRRRRKRQRLPRHSVNLSNTDIFLGAGSKVYIAGRPQERGGHMRTDSDVGALLLLGERPDSMAGSSLRTEMIEAKDVGGHDEESHIPLMNPYDEFGRSRSPLAPIMPDTRSFLSSSISNLSTPRLVNSPPVGIDFIAPTPSPAPFMLARPSPAPSLAASTPRGVASVLPPIAIPPPLALSTGTDGVTEEHPVGPLMFSATDTDGDSVSLYSLPSAPASQAPSRSSTNLLATAPPVPPLPAQYSRSNSSMTTIQPEKREIDFRDVGLPDPQFPTVITESATTSEANINRSDTEIIGTLLRKRAERVDNAGSLERSASQVSHIERAGSIKAAGEDVYGTRLARVRESQEVHVTESEVGTRSTKVSVHSKWAFDGVTNENAKDESGSTLSAPVAGGQSERAVSTSSGAPKIPTPLTAAFTPSLTSPPTPPSHYPYMQGQDSFYANTEPLTIRKENA